MIVIPTRQAQALALRRTGRTYAQIAGAMGLSHASVARYLQRAIRAERQDQCPAAPVDDWYDRAACAGRDPEYWDLPKCALQLTPANERALKICQTCPVISPCLDRARRTRPRGVIQGGLVWRGHG